MYVPHMCMPCLCYVKLCAESCYCCRCVVSHQLVCVLQDIISHVLTSHTKAEEQGIEHAADTMSRLQRAYDGWRRALLATQAPLTI